MARVQYTTIPESNYIYGIDSRSAENSIDPGFVKDLLNGDFLGKRVRKRVGVQGYSGNIPVRVTSLAYESTGKIDLTLDSAVSLADTTVDLTSVRSSPLVVFGRSSNISTGGPFTTSGDAARYYPGFVVPTRKFFAATAGAPPFEVLPVPALETGISTTDQFVGVVEGTSLTNRSYTLALPHSVDISSSTFDISVNYQNSTGTPRSVYVYYKDRTPTPGSSYAANVSHGGAGSQTFTILASTHGLDNYNILTSIQENDGSAYEGTIPEVIISSVGTVSVTIVSEVAENFRIILSATDVTNSATGNVQAATTSSIILSNLTSPWIFYGVYLEVTPGGDRQLVVPDSVTYDDTAATATLEFTNSMPTAANFFVYYEYGLIRSNILQVMDSSVTVDAIDSVPQLTIWGLDHSEIYGSVPPGRSGWATHIDSYKSAGERRVVTGLGGNLFSSRTFDEDGGTYLYPLLYPRLQARISSSVVVGPLLYGTSDTPARTRGYITSNVSGTGWGVVTAIQYDALSGYTVYTISLPGKQILDSTGTPTTLGAVISTTPGLEDYLSVDNMSYSRHEGVFRITSVVDGVDQIQVHADVPNNSSDYDDAGVAGAAGVFTDQITWLTSSPFIGGDVLVNAALGDTYIYTVQSSSGNTSVVSGVDTRLNLAGGLVTTGRRVSSLIPMRGPLPLTPISVTNIVRGDMLAYTGFDYLTNQSQVERLLRVNNVNPDTDRAVSFVLDPISMLVTVTMSSGDTSYLSEGSNILLLQSGAYTGEQTITSLVSGTQFEFSVSGVPLTLPTTGTLVGGVVEIDEQFEWEDTPGDTISLFAERRWIPVEAPDDLYDLTPSTYVRQLDSAPYGEQDFLRSTMVTDNMYLTNYSDEVFKYDGTSIYRAGLPPWQLGLYLTQDTGATAKIVISNRSITYIGATAGSAAGRVQLSGVLESGVLPVGTTTRLTGSDSTYTVTAYNDDGTNYYMYLDRSLDGTVADTGTASEIATYRYYMRLNAVDANDNVVASATTGFQDHVVELTADASVQLKLVAFPAWDDYDYTRIEAQIYRTKQSTPAPFYSITTIQVPFDKWTGYITYTDTFADADLINLDTVNTALKGQELGIQWQEPLRAKYVTSIGNRLVLANLRDYPQLDIQVISSGATDNSAYDGQVLLFRKSNLDTGTTTDMVNRVAYEWRSNTTGTVSSLTPSGNTFSFTTSSATGAAVGDWIYLSYSTVATTGRDLSYSGHWQISAISGTSVTVNYASAPTVTSTPDVYTIASDPTNIPVLLGIDGNLGMFNGNIPATFSLFNLMRRTSLAINSSMRVVDTTLSGMETFVPWMMCRSGNDSGVAGRLIVRHPRADTDFMEVVLPASFGTGLDSFEMFVNDIRRAPADEVSAVVRIYPSRLVASYQNFAEIMDNPISILDSESDSAVDVNSADGQEITGVIPFFGEAAYGAAQQAAVLVVFKQNSIYLVDFNEKAAGRNPVQRIETENLGCTAPYSIANTKGGIMFCNESGIYCLRRDQTIQYIGKWMERNWTERVDQTQLGIVQASHYSVGRLYKVSVPLIGQTANSEVFVYNHTEELAATIASSASLGSWSRYDSHPATGWTNLDTDAFYSSTQGRVLSLRNTRTITDYRDSSAPIQFVFDTRAVDAGDSGIRKILDALVVYYRVLQTEDGTSVSFSVDMAEEYRTTTPFRLNKTQTVTGTSDTINKDIIGILHNTNRRRGTHFQIRVQNYTLDENLEISGIELRIAGLNERGITQASQT